MATTVENRGWKPCYSDRTQAALRGNEVGGWRVLPEQRILFSIGYEGRNPSDFIAALATAGVTLLVDVRRLPLSHKRGFSKTALRSLVEGRGIGYKHRPELAPPMQVLRSYRESRDWAEFRNSYLRHASTQPGALQELGEMAESQTLCVMCVEADASRCHRSLLPSLLHTRHDHWGLQEL